MRAEHRYRIMLAMTSSTRPQQGPGATMSPAAPAATTSTVAAPHPGGVAPDALDSDGDDLSPAWDADVGTAPCSPDDCDDLPEIDADALSAIEPSDAELAFTFAPLEIVLDGVAI